jgi:hypothetical protein
MRTPSGEPVAHASVNVPGMGDVEVPGMAPEAVAQLQQVVNDVVKDGPKGDMAELSGHQRKLGEVTARYESGGSWDSAGKDNIGWAYGRYQFNSKGSLRGFLASNPEIAKEFQGLNPDSSAFATRWRRVYDKLGKKFENAQQDYFLRHARPSISAAQAVGFKTEDRGVMEAILSGSIQHGKWPQVVQRAAQAPGFASKPPAEQVRLLYKERARYVLRLGTIDDSTRHAVLKRYTSEVNYALRFVGQPTKQAI